MDAHQESPSAEKPYQGGAKVVVASKEILKKIVQALLKGDWSQRKMALLFFLSLAGASFAAGIATTRYLESRRLARERAERNAKKDTSCVEMSCAFNAMEELAKKKAELAEIRDATVNLGVFEVGLVGLGDGSRSRSGIMLEVELAIEFDSGDTGRWVSANLSPARSEVLGSIGAITGLTREDLLTPEGKSKVREQIRERVDSWLPSGKIKGIYFSKFLLQ